MVMFEAHNQQRSAMNELQRSKTAVLKVTLVSRGLLGLWNVEDDLLSEILGYLSSDDLARVSGVSRKFRYEHEVALRSLWEKHAADRWRILVAIVRRMGLDSAALRILNPVSSALNTALVSAEGGIVLDQASLTAEYRGMIGVSNRSVQGQVRSPLPKRAKGDVFGK
jgi:hypothetical protein